MSIVGFDFGTTNSLVSIIKDGRPINLLEDGRSFPSVVCYEGSRKIFGSAAKERLSGAGLGVKGNIVRSPKVHLGKNSIYIEGVEKSPVDIVSDVVSFISRRSVDSRRPRVLDEINQAVVTIPVDMEGYKRKALRDAFRIAGISIVQFVHEPLAALYGFFRAQNDIAAMLRKYERELILVFDWGGGTLDLTLCRLVDSMLIQVANDGTDEVGGDVFDDLLKNEIIRRVLLSRGLDETVEIQPDAETRLLHHCERAKIDLSTRNKVEVYVRRFFRGLDDEDLEYSLTRNELDEITGSLLTKGFTRISKLLKAADVSENQVAISLATGGMVNMPVIKARLHELFGAQRVQVSEHSATLIAEGAAWIAHDKAQLNLAKNVELLLARNSYMTLVRAGTSMPYEGKVQKDQFHLYCADPRDGHAKFELCVPVRPGLKVLPNDRRNPLGTMELRVDSKARPFHERIELDINIDDNLILKATSRSILTKDLSEAEVHNLEFGLSLIFGDANWDEKSTVVVDTKDTDMKHQKGELVMRSNIANRKDDSLVPGEFLYSYKPKYFDTRLNPPPVQDSERLYYEPCAVCRRASNDPLCKCASSLNY